MIEYVFVLVFQFRLLTADKFDVKQLRIPVSSFKECWDISEEREKQLASIMKEFEVMAFCMAGWDDRDRIRLY